MNIFMLLLTYNLCLCFSEYTFSNWKFRYIRMLIFILLSLSAWITPSLLFSFDSQTLLRITGIIVFDLCNLLATIWLINKNNSKHIQN
jgi:hypothetical protein